MLGPILFILYTADLVGLVERHGFRPHLYADGIQVYAARANHPLSPTSIAGLRRSDHITDTVASFHWLKAPERVQYKLATIVYRSPGFRLATFVEEYPASISTPK